MKMEILLEPTSNKLMVEGFDTSAGNPVKEVLLKLNLPDHRSILTDSKEYVKMVMEGTLELVEDDEEEDEDEEVEESSDSDSESEDAEDEGPTAEDDGPATGDEGLAVGDEGPVIRVEILGLGWDEAVPEGQQRAAPVVETAVGEPLRLGYGGVEMLGDSAEGGPDAQRTQDPKDGRAYIDVPAYPPTAPPVQTPPSPEWSFSSLLVSPEPSIGGLIHDHIVRLGKLLPALFERYDRDMGELFTRPGAVRDEIFSQRYRLRSLEHEQERVVVTFGAIWRPVLALDLWAGQTDAQRAAL
ncbi:hypothetical protein Tco_0810535 [Tanacetum coccineum]